MVEQLPACIKVYFIITWSQLSSQGHSLAEKSLGQISTEALAVVEVQDQLPRGWHQTQVGLGLCRSPQPPQPGEGEQSPGVGQRPHLISLDVPSVRTSSSCMCQACPSSAPREGLGQGGGWWAEGTPSLACCLA